MSSSIGGIGGSSAIHLREMRAMKRPDPAQMADALFSKLDSAKQGYIEKSDLQGAIAKVVSSSSARSSAAAATSDSASLANELFSKLDSNSDGKVTKQEFSDTLKKIGEQLDSQLMHARTTGAMAQGGANGTQAMNGPPPPRPPEGAGLTKEQLSSVASKMETSNSDLSSKLTALVTNFDQADTNGDGKISFQEAQAYQEANAAVRSSASASSAASSAGNNADTRSDALLASQIARLMDAYGSGNGGRGGASAELASV
ncbi:MAG: EF hand [Candidatus Accumulibacter regalis]|uniref:EF hand n=1 Tax=Accumulibacter regalis TaxID=522306 RepID=A0A011RBE5_ACCRE|nr:EF-hand domain-containing protein [Accumulibacter sp.]EXI88494.1 MAG: EF hand [Candidatus Accumulibacter regalis]HRE71005.1 EF-hand domain-containing protein [Accumulibacter sp.]